MIEAVLKEQIAELNDLLLSTAVGKATKTEGSYIPSPKPNQTVDELLGNLRLQLRYVMFDLEATRRENRYLRAMLESRPRPPQSDESDQPPMP
jgi:hypothetical protein